MLSRNVGYCSRVFEALIALLLNKTSARKTQSVCKLLLLIVQIAVHSASAAPQFSSHITVNTPARSFSHGVGDPIGLQPRRGYRRNHQGPRSLRRPPPPPSLPRGYPRLRPTEPFNNEDIRHHHNSINASPWQYSDMDVAIPLLPASPYKVDSPDPESLWPEGLFVPPVEPRRFTQRYYSRSDNTDEDTVDPYLLEGSEAIAAVQKADQHGELYFHNIPHIESLLANQDLRVLNNLQPHRVASIRRTWPYNRP